MVAEGELGATGPSEERHNVEVQDKKKTKAKTIATLAATGAGARGATAATAATAATVARKAGDDIYTIHIVDKVARKTPASKRGGCYTYYIYYIYYIRDDVVARKTPHIYDT